MVSEATTRIGQMSFLPLASARSAGGLGFFYAALLAYAVTVALEGTSRIVRKFGPSSRFALQFVMSEPMLTIQPQLRNSEEANRMAQLVVFLIRNNNCARCNFALTNVCLFKDVKNTILNNVCLITRGFWRVVLASTVKSLSLPPPSPPLLSSISLTDI